MSWVCTSVFYGKLTKVQHDRAQQKSKVRVDKVILALQWLVEHNEAWRQANVNLQEVWQKLQHSVIVDNSVSTRRRSNIEEQEETFKVFFPNGAMTEMNAGYESL